MLTGICSRCRQPSTPGLNLAKCLHCDGHITFEFKEDPDGIGFLVVNLTSCIFSVVLCYAGKPPRAHIMHNYYPIYYTILITIFNIHK